MLTLGIVHVPLGVAAVTKPLRVFGAYRVRSHPEAARNQCPVKHYRCIMSAICVIDCIGTTAIASARVMPPVTDSVAGGMVVK